jgi:hypothetical protein
MSTGKVNITINFNAAHIKPEFHTGLTRDDIRYEEFCFVLIKNQVFSYYPWASISKLVRENVV